MTVGASTDQDKPVKVAVDVEFYDGDGNKFDLTQRNAIVALNSSTTGQVLPMSIVEINLVPFTVEIKIKMVTLFVELGIHMQMVHP